MKLLVTGASGFLGYHFVLKALECGHEIMCLKRLSSVSMFSDEIEKRIKWVNDDENLIEHVRAFGPEVLFHAAWGGVRGADRDSSEVQHDNVLMSKKIFELFPYRQIICLGSQAEYGYYTDIVSENDPILPDTEYGKAKNECRALLQDYATERNIDWVWIRIFTVFGEKQSGGLIAAFTGVCRSGQPEFNTTPGEQRYSYLYAPDFAGSLCSVIGKYGKSGVYNLSQPIDVYSNRSILAKIKNNLDSGIKINFGAIPYSPNQIMLMDGDVSKFESQFGTIRHTPFDDALDSTIKSI